MGPTRRRSRAMTAMAVVTAMTVASASTSSASASAASASVATTSRFFDVSEDAFDFGRGESVPTPANGDDGNGDGVDGTLEASLGAEKATAIDADGDVEDGGEEEYAFSFQPGVIDEMMIDRELSRAVRADETARTTKTSSLPSTSSSSSSTPIEGDAERAAGATKEGSLGAGGFEALRQRVLRNVRVSPPHGERFSNWLSKYPGKLKRYCGEEPPPCAESRRREEIFNENVAKVDEHNARQRKGGMRMRVGKFADLTEAEFASRHTAFEKQSAAKTSDGPTHEGDADAVASLGAAKRRKEAEQSKETLSESPKSAAAARRRGRRHAKGKGEEKVEKTDKASPVKEHKLLGQDAKRAMIVRKEDGLKVRAKTETTKDELDPRFIQFARRYGKTNQYCPDTFPCPQAFQRQKIFLRNLEEIEAANANVAAGGMKKRVTRFADLDANEFAERHATYSNSTQVTQLVQKPAAHDHSTAASVTKLPTLGDLSQADIAALHTRRQVPRRAHRVHHSATPRVVTDAETTGLGVFQYESAGFDRSLDWREKIDIGPVYSQGTCSGCWAFSTAQVVADSRAISSGARTNVSPYHLLACDDLDSACNTGNMATAYAWINVQPKGVLRASDFPEGSSCSVANDPSTVGVKIEGYCEITPLEGSATVMNIMRALKQQSVAVGVNIKPLQLYGGGIVRMADCPPASTDPLLAINHAAVLIGWGYDEETDQGYWIMKNSYDTDWGEDGYAKLSMEIGDGGYGTCGLYTEQNFPLTDGKACTSGATKKWSIQRGDDVYLEPDDVLILPNGQGLITPFKFQIFGFDLTSTLQMAAMFCFSLCFVLILIEIYFCIFPELDSGDDEDEDAGSPGKPSVGSSLLKAEEGSSYGADGDAKSDAPKK